MHRRQFLETTVASSLVMAGHSSGAEPTRLRSVVIDTHLHCFAGKNDPRFPYHPRSPYQPEKPATPEHLLKCMAEAGVDHAIVVHPEPYQDDHLYLEHCLTVGKDKLKGTCLFFADRPDSLSRMSDLVKKHERQIVAARIHAYAPDRLPPFGKPELRAFWKHVGDLGLAVQLHFEPRYASGFEPLIREFDQTKVIIDHLGRPMQGTQEEYAVVLAWSRLPNTVMKLSALPEKGQYPHRDVGPILKDLTERFGADRLIYGGGFGPDATGDSYRAYRERLRSYLTHLPAEDQARILGGTAARLFGFDTT
ncbi:MAG TPA: amidohydrolase family protein [Isosphaeraceae bacterium]|jgi:predicted TIM-barrel fold metal-dependent hydrolase|nr:amidohydrolase family protein [Isosphaeraceae bacterium]